MPMPTGDGGGSGEQGGSAFVVPSALWADVVSKCSDQQNYRTSYVVSVDAVQRVGVHAATDDRFAYIILSDAATPRRTAHYVIDEIAKLFRKMHVEPAEVLTARACASFDSQMDQMLKKMSDPKNVEDKIQKVRAAVDEVKGLALDNIDRVIQRGEKIEEVVSRTEELETQAMSFQRAGRNLRTAMWWHSMRNTLLMGGIVVGFLFSVYLIYCGGLSCSSSSKKT